MAYSVYKHTDPNGLVYIGITGTDPEKRWNKGYGYSANERFFFAIKKYGWENIKHEILYSELDFGDAVNTEKQLIAEYKSNDPAYGYNISPGGVYDEETYYKIHPAYQEEWRLVEGTEDFYVSNHGRVKRNNRIKKQQKDPEGYMLCYIGTKKVRVHRLVAKAFIPNPDNLPVVDHLDGNKANNFVENLRWCTIQENTQAAYDLGLNKGSKQRTIIAINTKTHEAYLYNSQIDASEATGVPISIISKIVRGIYSKSGVFTFVRCNGTIHDYRE